MKTISLIAVLITLAFSKACCESWEQPQPSHPGTVANWAARRVYTVRVVGEFVLKEGESTESGSMGIKVVKLSPLVTCLKPLSEPPRKEVVLRIYNPTDKTVLCESTVGEGSGRLPCANGASLPSVSVNGINTREGWVWFSLNETVAD